MPSFSQVSKDRLATTHPDLQKLFNEIIKDYDCTILCGFRNQADQDKAYAEGRSKLKWPNGNHNKNPSRAVDVMPYPIDWKDTDRICLFAGYVLGTAKQMGINIRWGGDWNGNHETKDERFIDSPHFELI